MAAAVADINRAVAEEDFQNTLQALQVPSAGLRAVLPECADTYHSELAQRQTSSATNGKLTFSRNMILWVSIQHLLGLTRHPLLPFR